MTTLSASLEEKQAMIQANERKLAGVVALGVIDKPLLALWMIMIPIFFVFYYFQLRRYKNGLRDFIHNYMITRNSTLEAVREGLENDHEIDIEAIVSRSLPPEDAKAEFRNWVTTLAEYYRLLLQSSGNSFEELARNSFASRTNYLLTVNRLNSAERQFNRALLATMTDREKTFGSITAAMEQCAEQFRREQGAELF